MIYTITDEQNLLGAEVTRIDVLNLVSHYRDTQYGALDDAVRSKYAYFSISELENFMTNMKAQNADGIRIYFAAVPADYVLSNAEYIDRLTTVLVGTKKLDTGINDEILDINSKIAVAFHTHTNAHAYDFATLCPPDCSHKIAAAGTNGASIADDVYRLNLP